MSAGVTHLARPEVLRLVPYASARAAVALDGSGIAPDGLPEPRVFLDANESPWSPDDSDPLLAGIHRYPEPQPRALLRTVAEICGVDADSVLLGRGVDEGIDLLARTFCRPGLDRVLVCPPTYGMYAVAAGIQGAPLVEVPYLRRGARFVLDADGVQAASAEGVKLVFLCSPDNPTGQSIEAEVVDRLARSLAGRALLVLDEAYVEFSTRGGLTGRVREHENLVVLRTFSKAWGLAGARLGAVVAPPGTIELLKRVVAPYPLALPVVRAAERALDEAGRARVRERVAVLRRERDLLAERLATAPGVLEVFPSDANFLLVRVADAAGFVRRCREQGIVVRDRSGEHGLAGCVRISVGTAEENRSLLEALSAEETLT